MHKLIIRILILSSAFSCNAQNQSTNDTLEMHPFELADTMFGSLSPINFPSGKLYDRVLDPMGITSTLDGTNLVDKIDMNTWLAVYTEMYWASGRSQNMTEPIDIYTDFINGQEATFSQGGVRLPIAILDYDYQKLDSSALQQGMIYTQGISVMDYGLQSAQAFKTIISICFISFHRLLY